MVISEAECLVTATIFVFWRNGNRPVSQIRQFLKMTGEKLMVFLFQIANKKNSSDFFGSEKPRVFS